MSYLDFVSIDLETTGLDEKNNEITEIGITKFKNGELIDEYSTLIKPTQKISHYVQKITGITNDMVSLSPVFSETIQDVISFIGDNLIVGHNISFDMGMLNNALTKEGKDILENPTIDTLDIISLLNPTGRSFKLSYLAKKYKILEENVHRAKDDSLMTANLYLKLIEEIKNLDRDIVSLLLYYFSKTNISMKIIFEELFSQDIEKNEYPWVAFKFNKIDYQKERIINDSFQNKDINYLFSLFQEDGLIAKNFPDFELRSSQVDMIEKIFRSLENSTHLIIEAGTGTGKSLAYLLSTLFFSLKYDKTIVISTKTKSLQEQLIEKDIPTLKKALGLNFKAEMLKGKENYVCLNKFSYTLNNALLSNDDSYLKGIFSIMLWIISSKRGDLSEIHNSLKIRYGTSIKADTKSCLQSNCPFKQVCFINNIKDNAKYANLLIVNHAFLLSDIRYGKNVLPDFDHLVLDEAHSLEDVATSCFSLAFSKKKLNETFSKISDGKILDSLLDIQELQELKKKARNAIRLNNKWFSIIEDVFKNKEKNNVFFKKSQKRIGFNEIEEETVNNIYEFINDLIGLLLEIKPIINIVKDKAKNTTNITQRSFLRSIGSEIDSVIKDLSILHTRDNSYIRWLEKNEKIKSVHFEMIMTPVNLSNVFRKDLIENTSSIIHTSATLSIKDNFNYYLSRMGYLESNVTFETAIFTSTFDLENRMLLCVPADSPFYKDDNDYIKNLTNYLKTFLISVEGKALVLFTSHKHLNDCYHELKKSLDKANITLYCQGKQMSDKNLIKSFKEKKDAVLMGTDTFWEGVDIPGRNLSYVIVVKLPFDVPTDPIVLARMEQVANMGRSSFFDYSIPKAIMKFKQGIGRLIRTNKDKGAVIILDKRVKHKGYGKAFINAITAKKISPEDLPSMITYLKVWIG
jgi:ATP-dependent DNA helicase DinG